MNTDIRELLQAVQAGSVSVDDALVQLNDGKLELMLIRAPKTVTELHGILHTLSVQDYSRSPMITFKQAKTIAIRGEVRLPWSLDGEFAPSAPVVTITNHQQALTVLL